MEYKKDIGDLLKNRLDEAQKAPQQNLWERLDNSLNEREKKRRRAAWFWYGGAGLLLALLLLGGTIWTQDEKDVLNTSSKISAEENTENIELENETDATNEIVTQNGTETSLNDGTEADETNTTETNNNITKQQSKATKKAITTKRNTSNKPRKTEDGFSVTTTHEYYNSDLDTTTTSQNKQQIDSLVAANKRVMAIKDSIARQRATDSIKLNEVRKDSIRE